MQSIHENERADESEHRMSIDRCTLLIAAIAVAGGAGWVGWELRGIWEPIYDNRGWAILLILAVTLAAAIATSNRHRD